MRHEITLEDGRVFEACSAEERMGAAAGNNFYLFNQWYRLKKREPRTVEGRVTRTTDYLMDRVIPLPADWAVGTAVIVTEKVQG